MATNGAMLSVTLASTPTSSKASQKSSAPCCRRSRSSGGAAAIARRARGTPRVALRLLRRVRDFAEVRASGHIDVDVAEQALALLEVDALGLDDLDRRVLEAFESIPRHLFVPVSYSAEAYSDRPLPIG